MTLRSAFLPDVDRAAVAEPEERGGVGGLLLDDVLERQLRAAVPIARPVREHERGDRRVADQEAVRATVGQPRDARGVQQHLADRVVVAVDVVEERQHEQVLRVVLEHQVVELGERVDAVGRGQRRDGAVVGGLVVGRVAERVDAVERRLA